jgi:hypothetical protein
MDKETFKKLSKYAHSFVVHGKVFDRKKRREIAFDYLNSIKEEDESHTVNLGLRNSMALSTKFIKLIDDNMSDEEKDLFVYYYNRVSIYKTKTFLGCLWQTAELDWQYYSGSLYVITEPILCADRFASSKEEIIYWQKISLRMDRLFKTITYKDWH